MLEEFYANILEKIKFDKRDKFEALLHSSITSVWREQEQEPDYRFKSISFKIDVFFSKFSPFVNFYGKNRKYLAGAEALYIICSELQIDVDEAECFLLFHIRNIGKFRKKESDLYDELMALWNEYPEFKMESRNFSRALKNLMRNKIIEYRKGNIHLNTSVMLRYRL